MDNIKIIRYIHGYKWFKIIYILINGWNINTFDNR